MSTKLEEEIFEALGQNVPDGPLDGYTLEKHYASAAAEVCKRYIEKAWEDGYESRNYTDGEDANLFKDANLNTFLIENGIVENPIKEK